MKIHMDSLLCMTADSSKSLFYFLIQSLNNFILEFEYQAYLQNTN